MDTKVKSKKSAAAEDDIGRDIRLELFRMQLELRLCEKRAYDLFLQNLIKGTSHLSLGQEAIAAGFGVAMQPGDKSFCTYRGHAHTLARGAPMDSTPPGTRRLNGCWRSPRSLNGTYDPTIVVVVLVLGGSAMVLGHLSLAEGVNISAASLVTRSIHKAGHYTGIFPLDDNAAWEKNAASLKQLYSLRERIRALEQKLKTLEQH